MATTAATAATAMPPIMSGFFERLEAGAGDAGAGAAGVVDAATFAPSTASVAGVEPETVKAFPHPGQNFKPSGSSQPQLGQNMMDP